jgi:hypothetical protein
MRPCRSLAILLPLVVVAGCSTMGSGYGSTATGTNPVHFAWESSDNVSGTMYATLPDGSIYAGHYFEITTETTVDTLGPLWVGWGPRWRGGEWNYWGAGPEFVTHYSGQVVANLANPDGRHVRCNFQLVHPDQGLAGGGDGDCQLPNGKTIDTTFPGAS